MSAQQDMMTAATTACEVAVQQLAQAYADYRTAYRIAAQNVSSASGLQGVAALEQSVGPSRLTQSVSARMTTLGFPLTLASAPVDAEWTAWLTNQIQHHVP